MRTHQIRGALCASLLLAAGAPAATLWEQDGVSLEGSVRLVARAAATCVVSADGQSPEGYEAMKANHGQPLHVWRLDYEVYNGSGRGLSQVTAHMRIESEWPPCSRWDGPTGSFPGPLEWAGSFKTLQRTGGLGAGEEAGETVYVLAFHDRQPRFANWQVDFRFGAPSGAQPGGQSPVRAQPAGQEPESEISDMLQPLCTDVEWFSRCWVEIDSPSGCHIWVGFNGGGEFDGTVSWSGECLGGVASGTGTLSVESNSEYFMDTAAAGRIERGKRTGPWVKRAFGRRGDNTMEGSFVDGERDGLWVWRTASGLVVETPYVNGKRHGRGASRFPDGKVSVDLYEDDRPIYE